MKHILLLIMILTAVSLFGISQGTMLFLSFEPSSINLAMGGDVIGVVNVWHNNPLTTYANPALAAFHEGLSVGYASNPWGYNSGLNDMEYNASLINIGYKGIALTLPGYNASDKWGITLDQGTQMQVDSQGNLIGVFKAWDHAKVAGLAINPLEVSRSMLNLSAPWLQYVDLAVGASYVDTYSLLEPASGITEHDAEADAVTTNLGAVARLNYCYNETFGLEAVYGLSHFNTSLAEISYTDDSQVDPIYNHRNQGFAFAASLKAEKLLSSHLPGAAMFFSNLLSIRYLNATKAPMYNKAEQITASGTEIGFLDTFYIRNGQYDDDAGHINGNTSGWGMNLHYRDLVSFSYNKASYPGGGLFGEQESEDYGFSFDFVSLGKAIFK